MKSKLFFLILLISLSSIITIEEEPEEKNFQIPFSMKLGKKEPLIEGSISPDNLNFLFSLNSPYILYHKNEEPKTENQVKIALPPLLEKNLTGDLSQGSIKIKTNSKDLEFDTPIITGNFINVSDPLGVFGLAPKAENNDITDYNSNSTLGYLRNKGKIYESVFSFNFIDQTLDGSYQGILYLGKRHIDFQTSKGYSVICENEFKYSWGCKFEKLLLENRVFNLNNVQVKLSSETPAAYFNTKYIDEFKKLFPEGANCDSKIIENGNSMIECTNWNMNELEVFLQIKDHKLKVKIPDLNNIEATEKFSYRYKPYIIFSDKVEGAYLPLFWFKGYHILFNDEAIKPQIKFYSPYYNVLIEPQKDLTDYVSISTPAFVFLCISFGIVFLFLIGLIGYCRLNSNKPTRGLKPTKTFKGQKKTRMATFDSALLGTSDENMPKRLKTTLNYA